MLLTHVFETLEYQTVGWRTDIDNHRSQQAIERLGAKKDGVIRGNRVRRNGVISDTVMYSMVRIFNNKTVIRDNNFGVFTT